MKTATIELPAILVSTINAFEFPGNPLWRVGQGLDHVKIELTYKLPTDQPTVSVEQKEKPVMSNPKRGKAKRRTEPAPSAGEWPRQSLPAKQPPSTPAKPTRQQPRRNCKTPRRELPTSPLLRQCPPPATTTIIEEPTTIQRPTIEKATIPLPPPRLLPPPTEDDLSDYSDYDDERPPLPANPDLSDLPTSPYPYDVAINPLDQIFGRDFDVAAVRRYNNIDYFQCYFVPEQNTKQRHYARYDPASNAIIVACPQHPDGREDIYPHVEPVYKYFKNIFHAEATPVTETNLANYFKLRYAAIFEICEDSDG